MGRRTLCIAIAAAALLAGAGCGSDSATEPVGRPTSDPAEGTYVGITSQGLPIRFDVTGETIGRVMFGWRAICDDGQEHQNTIEIYGSAIRNGLFSFGGKLETGGVAHVDGQFTTEGATGMLSRAKGSAFGTDCKATGISWRARVAPGRSIPADPDPGPDAGTSA